MPQWHRTFEGHDPFCFEHHVLIGWRIPVPPAIVVFDTELPKTTDQDIVSAFQRPFHDFKEGPEQLGRPGFGQPESLVD